MADGEDSGKKIKICVKTPKEKKDVEVEQDGHIKELREQAAEAFGAEVGQLCLIFAGKILKDHETLEAHSIKDGLTVHLVIKSANRAQEQAAQRAQQTAAPAPPPSSQQPGNVGNTPFGLGSMGGLPGMSGLGMGSANFMDMQQRMQSELMGNPEMLRQLMDNPMIQQLMSNPDVMRQMITSNPQMRELMERNPEITHMLNNPELMRQTMELARNPAMLQELMRTQDRAMSNLESLPGGFNALQRMYRDIQEPMMNAATEGMRPNPFASLVNSGNASQGQQGQENTNPLPNPWAPASTGSSSSTAGTGQTAGGPAGQEVFNTPGMQSLMSQMSTNPQLMQNMLQAPYMQSMLQALSANPELSNQMIGANPMFAGNPQLQTYMRQMLPTFLEQMQNPDVQTMMTNPRALSAIMQIQQGMQQLQTEAPDAFQTMGIPGMSMPPTGFPGAAATTAGTTPAATTTTTSPSPSSPATAAPTDTTSTTTAASPASDTTGSGTTPTPAPTTTAGAGGAAGQQDMFSNFMASMVQMMAAGQQGQPPEQRFASQLDQLAGMGFVDRQANIQALIATFGDVNAAIDRLLQQRENT